MSAALLLPAMLLDAALGEPKWLWDRLPHPAVLMGRAIAAVESRIALWDGLRLSMREPLAEVAQ